MSSSNLASHPLKIVQKYKFVKVIGKGSYGTVWSAIHIISGTEVAIKKVGARNFEEMILAKRALRELKLLRHLTGHDNIASFYDADVNEASSSFNELYLVEGLMEADLHQIVKSKQNLTDQHYQYFMYQLLKGLKWMHSANVLHRDLKPGNLLINSDCELRICDFGLARGMVEEHSKLQNTEYVATRYYRAPEVVLSPKHYSKAIDIWSVGCIFGELLGGKIMFKGEHYVDQLKRIFELLGTPVDPTLTSLCSAKVVKYIQTWPKYKMVALQRVYPDASPQAINLLENLLKFHPNERISAEEALKHPYLSAYHNPNEESNHTQLFDFSFENAKTIPEIKDIVLSEIKDLKTKRSEKQNVFQTPLASPIHQKPFLNTAQVQDVPRYFDNPEFGTVVKAITLEEEVANLNIA